MPLTLGKSNATREKNISREIASGRDPKQAAAIGYAEQRKARHIKAADMDMKKSAKGIPALAVSFGEAKPEGAVDDEGTDEREAAIQKAGDAAMEAFHANDGAGFMKAIAAGMKAHGEGDEGEAEEPEEGDEPEE